MTATGGLPAGFKQQLITGADLVDVVDGADFGGPRSSLVSSWPAEATDSTSTAAPLQQLPGQAEFRPCRCHFLTIAPL